MAAEKVKRRMIFCWHTRASLRHCSAAYANAPVLGTDLERHKLSHVCKHLCPPALQLPSCSVTQLQCPMGIREPESGSWSLSARAAMPPGPGRPGPGGRDPGRDSSPGSESRLLAGRGSGWHCDSGWPHSAGPGPERHWQPGPLAAA